MLLVRVLVLCLLYSKSIEDEIDESRNENPLQYDLFKHVSTSEQIVAGNVISRSPSSRRSINDQTRSSSFLSNLGHVLFGYPANSDSTKPNQNQNNFTCRIRRYENVYFYGQLLGVAENVTKMPTCAYLCWRRRMFDGKCSSVNYLRDMNRCEFMQDAFDTKVVPIPRYYAQGKRNSIYMVPLSCGGNEGVAIITDGGNSTHNKPDVINLPNNSNEENEFRRGACGRPSIRSRMSISQSVERIVGGSEARPHSHPWVVSLQRSKGNHFCGGTLVRVGNADRSDIVITAAHCVVRPTTNLQVGAGLHDVRRLAKGAKKIRVRKTITHPNYSSRTQQNDIAVLLLDEPLSFGSTIQPICLPRQGDHTPDGALAYVVGWGNKREGGLPSSSLMEVVVPVISTRECSNGYGSRMPIFPQAMVCAGVQGKDSCQGDSGGPLALKNGNGFVLHGVVSFGDGCARAKKPGVYTRVSNYVTWINDQIVSISTLKG